MALLPVFIRGIDSEFTITEELLSLVPMKGTTTGKDLLDAILKVMVDFNLDYKRQKGITTDGAPSVMEDINGLAVRLKNILLTTEVVHYQNFIALFTNRFCVPEALNFVT